MAPSLFAPWGVGMVRAPVAFCGLSSATLHVLEVGPDVLLFDVPPATRCSDVDCGYGVDGGGGRADT